MSASAASHHHNRFSVCNFHRVTRDFFERFDKEKYGSEGAPLHDPCVIAYLIQPDLFTGRHVNVEIETKSELTLGMTVADWWRVTERPANAMFMGDLDADGFFALLTERIGRL